MTQTAEKELSLGKMADPSTLQLMSFTPFHSLLYNILYSNESARCPSFSVLFSKKKKILEQSLHHKKKQQNDTHRFSSPHSWIL